MHVLLKLTAMFNALCDVVLMDAWPKLSTLLSHGVVHGRLAGPFTTPLSKCISMLAKVGHLPIGSPFALPSSTGPAMWYLTVNPSSGYKLCPLSPPLYTGYACNTPSRPDWPAHLPIRPTLLTLCMRTVSSPTPLKPYLQPVSSGGAGAC